MASSADRRVAMAAAAACAAALAGCVSTEQKATWAHITDARTIASQSPTIVRHASDEVRVTGVTLLQAGGRVAIAVGLRNLTAHPVNDIPISVASRGAHGRTVYLNRAAGLGYFKTHVAAIPARGRVTWVFTTRRRRPLAGRIFAVAGRQPKPAPIVAHVLPPVRAVMASVLSATARRSALRVTVTNASTIPQVGLQVYALVGRSGRYSAAGSATVSELGNGKTTTTRIDLIGRLQGAAVQLEALPTMFQ